MWIRYYHLCRVSLKYVVLSCSELRRLQLSGGYHFWSQNDPNSFFYADAPLLLQMNVGHLASKDFHNDFGFFLGTGYDFNYLKNSTIVPCFNRKVSGKYCYTTLLIDK